MRTVRVFEKGERVMIDFEVESLVLVDGQIQYELKSPRTGKSLKYYFTAEEIYPLEKGGEAWEESKES